MNIFKKTLLILVMAISFSAVSTVASAEQAASQSASGNSEIVTPIEKAVVEISKSDFAAAQVLLKAARVASERSGGNSDVAKQAYALLIQGQILAKKGEVNNAIAELNKAIELYKSY